MPSEGFGKENAKVARDLVEYAIRLETAGDVVDERLATLATSMHKKGVRFSKEGWAEITRMHEVIVANMQLASNVLISDDLESARLLSLEKTEVKRMPITSFSLGMMLRARSRTVWNQSRGAGDSSYIPRR